MTVPWDKPKGFSLAAPVGTRLSTMSRWIVNTIGVKPMACWTTNQLSTFCRKVVDRLPRRESAKAHLSRGIVTFTLAHPPARSWSRLIVTYHRREADGLLATRLAFDDSDWSMWWIVVKYSTSSVWHPVERFSFCGVMCSIVSSSTKTHGWRVM